MALPAQPKPLPAAVEQFSNTQSNLTRRHVTHRHTANCAVLTLHVQVVHSPYKGISDCVVRMLREEGIGAFYKSYRTTVRALPHPLVFTGSSGKSVSSIVSIMSVLAAPEDCAAHRGARPEQCALRAFGESQFSPFGPRTRLCVMLPQTHLAARLGSSRAAGLYPDPVAPSQLVMNVPFTAIYFSTYESAKKLLNQADREEGLLTQLTAGGVAGAWPALEATSAMQSHHQTLLSLVTSSSMSAVCCCSRPAAHILAVQLLLHVHDWRTTKPALL